MIKLIKEIPHPWIIVDMSSAGLSPGDKPLGSTGGERNLRSPELRVDSLPPRSPSPRQPKPTPQSPQGKLQTGIPTPKSPSQGVAPELKSPLGNQSVPQFYSLGRRSLSPSSRGPVPRLPLPTGSRTPILSRSGMKPHREGPLSPGQRTPLSPGQRTPLSPGSVRSERSSRSASTSSVPHSRTSPLSPTFRGPPTTSSQWEGYTQVMTLDRASTLRNSGRDQTRSRQLTNPSSFPPSRPGYGYEVGAGQKADSGKGLTSPRAERRESRKPEGGMSTEIDHELAESYMVCVVRV